MLRKTSFQPLLLITRPEPSASETATILRMRGYEVLVSPALVAEPALPYDLRLQANEQLIVTSPQAARMLTVWTALHLVPVWAVGKHTADLLSASGFKTVVHGDSYDAQSLLDSINKTARQQLFCILGAPSTGRALQARLRRQGRRARRVAVYRIVPAEKLSTAAAIALSEGRITHALFYSARTAQYFLKLAQDIDLAGITAICLSTAVAAPLRKRDFRAIKTPAKPTSEALQALLPALD